MNTATLTTAWAPLKPLSPLIAEEWTLGAYRIVLHKGEKVAKLYKDGEVKALAGGYVGSLKMFGAAYFAEEIAAGFAANQVAAHEDGDVQVNDQGTIVFFRPMTDKARSWFDEQVDADALWMGPSLVVEHRYAPYLIEGIVEAGFEVRRSH